MRLKARLARLELAFKTRNAEHFLEVCLCFPADEQPWFRWRVEAEEAAKVLCPLHGRRFQTVVRHHLYQALHFYVADFDHGWPGWSIQYQKAMRASLDPHVADFDHGSCAISSCDRHWRMRLRIGESGILNVVHARSRLPDLCLTARAAHGDRDLVDSLFVAPPQQQHSIPGKFGFSAIAHLNSLSALDLCPSLHNS